MIDLKITVQSRFLTVDKKELKAALRAAGSLVAKRAKALILDGHGGNGQHSRPYQAPASQTGLLASQVKVRTAFRGMVVNIIDDAQSTSDAKKAYYSRFLETGAVGGGGKITYEGGIKKKGKGKGVANKVSRSGGERTVQSVGSTRVMLPRPYLTTALQQSESEITRRIEKALLNGIKFKAAK